MTQQLARSSAHAGAQVSAGQERGCRGKVASASAVSAGCEKNEQNPSEDRETKKEGRAAKDHRRPRALRCRHISSRSFTSSGSRHPVAPAGQSHAVPPPPPPPLPARGRGAGQAPNLLRGSPRHRGEQRRNGACPARPRSSTAKFWQPQPGQGPRHFVDHAFAVCMAALPKSAGRESRNCYAAIRTQQIIPRLAI
jgi:hypothetical protein